MATISFLLQQPYKKSQNPNRELAKIENQTIKNEIRLRKSLKKNYDSLLNPRETRIYLFLIFDRNNKIKIKTDEKILPKYWDFSNQIVKPNYIGVGEFNSRLLTLKSNVQEKYRRISNDTPGITFNEIANKIIDLVKNRHAPVITKSTLNQYIDEFIKDLESGKMLTPKGEKFKKGTIKNYNGFKTQFDLYQEKITKHLNFDDINMTFYYDFIGFFNNKNYSINTIGRMIKSIKAIVRSAREKGITNNIEVEKKQFKVLKAASMQIYLTEDEITKIYKLDLSDKPLFDESRDVFIIGVRLAQRFSDYSKLSKNKIKKIGKDKYVINIIQEKGSELVTIPMHWQIKEILEKYNYVLPKVYEQKVNERIKKVGGLAEINEPIIYEKIEGGERIQYTTPKHDLITTHTARRTGATLMYLAGISPIDIMKITGHTTEREFLKYIKVSKEETAKSLSNHPYFRT